MSDNTHISELGEFVYPHLNKPDVRFNEAGEYKLSLKVPQKQALSMITLIDKELDASNAKAEQENKGKKIKQAPKPYKIEDGNAIFKFKMKATGINKRLEKPLVRNLLCLTVIKIHSHNQQVFGVAQKVKSLLYQKIITYLRWVRG